jgi:hypothetical protein
MQEEPSDVLGEIQHRINKHVKLFTETINQTFKHDHLPKQGQNMEHLVLQQS